MVTPAHRGAVGHFSLLYPYRSSAIFLLSQPWNPKNHWKCMEITIKVKVFLKTKPRYKDGRLSQSVNGGKEVTNVM